MRAMVRTVPIALFYYLYKSEQLKANQIWEFCYSNDGEI